MQDVVKNFVADYQSAQAVLATAARPENGKPLAKWCKLCRGPRKTLRVMYLHRYSEFVEGTEAQRGRYEPREDWVPIVTYFPNGTILVDRGGRYHDDVVQSRIIAYSPTFLYTQGFRGYDMFFRWHGTDYVFGDHGVMLPAEPNGLPYYVVPKTTTPPGNKLLHNGCPCVGRDEWNRRETDRDEARWLLDRLGYLITKHEMWDLLGWKVAQRAQEHFDAVQKEVANREGRRIKASNKRDERAQTRLEQAHGRRMRSINLEESACGDTTTPVE